MESLAFRENKTNVNFFLRVGLACIVLLGVVIKEGSHFKDLHTYSSQIPYDSNTDWCVESNTITDTHLYPTTMSGVVAVGNSPENIRCLVGADFYPTQATYNITIVPSTMFIDNNAKTQQWKLAPPSITNHSNPDPIIHFIKTTINP